MIKKDKDRIIYIDMLTDHHIQKEKEKQVKKAKEEKNKKEKQS